MKPSDKKPSKGITRRDALKYSGLALGGLAFGGALIGPGARRAYAGPYCTENACDYPVKNDKITQEYNYFEKLPTITPWGYEVDARGELFLTGTPLEDDEMRITFLGSMVPPVRRAQQEMSVFVEVGWDHDNQCPMDQFVFDCGSGVCANYGAMGIGYGRMNKIFLAHLHGDHMSDLAHIYCFGPSADRKSPLYVWGPGPSGVKNPDPPPRFYKDGTKAFCEHLREAMRWHSESFSFEATSWTDSEENLPTQDSWGLPVKPVPVGDDPPYDGYALVPIELNWTKYGEKWEDNVAYHNKETGVKITHFPVIHTRKGAIGYKLEWTPPRHHNKKLTMIYTSDTRPETRCIDQANNVDPITGVAQGVDVFIHEMGLPPEVWAMKNLGLDAPDHFNLRFDEYVEDLKDVINCSHTPPGAFGYLLNQIDPRPQLTVATHFPVADDTVECALNSVKEHVPDIKCTLNAYNEEDDIAWSFDLMVIRVRESEPYIGRYQALVNDFGFSPVTKVYATNDPKYTNTRKQQLDTSMEIPWKNKDGSVNYCKNGY
jgi:ribonuclease Z